MRAATLSSHSTPHKNPTYVNGEKLEGSLVLVADSASTQ